jgi:aryl-alcohol dehydrogenase-like predicted oxidoreductase
MEYRLLGRSGLKVSVLSFGAATFGGGNEFFAAWGNTGVDEARRMVDLCLDAGVNLFDVANGYSNGLAEEILGKAIQGKRDKLLISTKAFFPMGEGPNDLGSSRHHILEQCDASLKRLGTDHIDIYHMHGHDALTPVEEVLDTLTTLVHAGKIRYIACSNFSGWHLMKSLAVSDRYGWTRYVAHQVYYSMIGREYEWELMPLGEEQGVGALIWSPLGWGRLTGKLRRGAKLPEVSRLHTTADAGPPVADEFLYRVVDAIDEVAKETGKIRSANRAQLAAPAPDGLQRHHRRAYRRTAQAKPPRRRLEPHPRASSQTRCRQRCHPRLPLLAPAYRQPKKSSRCPLRPKDRRGLNTWRRSSWRTMPRSEPTKMWLPRSLA